MRLTALFALAFLLIGMADAATKTPSMYAIEIAVIEHRLPELEGGEVWVKGKLDELIAEVRQGVEAGPPAENSVLGRAANKLVKSGRHRLLVHRRWTQQALPKSDTNAFRLRSADQTLDGVARFYLVSRSLLVDLHLALAGEKLTLDRPESITGPVFQMLEHRRIKLQEVHYFDHPRFGVLLLVTPLGKN